MSWREQLIPATFRGVPFFVDSHEAELGRRVQVHEFPFRDLPQAEDLGRKARVLTVQAYVLGADYMARRDALIRAVERPGPGQLEHPYLGELKATCTNCRLTETTREGGMARLSLDFVESGEARFVTSQASTADNVRSSRDNTLLMAQAAFDARYKVAGRPEFVAEASQSLLGSALETMQAAAGKVRAVADKVAQLTRAVTQAKQQFISIVYAPASAAQAVLSNLRLLVREVAYGPREALDLARTLFRFGLDLPAVPETTSNRRAQAVNQAAMTQLVRVVAVAEAAGAVAELAFESYADAEAVRAELVAVMDELLEQPTLADEMYDTLRALRAATVRDITTRGADLARALPYTPPTTLPALVVAHLVYTDARRADELVTRNRVPHPSFVAGQRVLEVLADG